MKAFSNALNPPVTHNVRYQITFVFWFWCLPILDSLMPTAMAMATPYLFAFLIVLRFFHKNPFRKIVFNFRIFCIILSSCVWLAFHFIGFLFASSTFSIRFSCRNGFWSSKYRCTKWTGRVCKLCSFLFDFLIKIIFGKDNLNVCIDDYFFSGATFEACILMCG